MRVLATILLMLIAQSSLAVAEWETRWLPDQDNSEVVVYMHYTFQNPMVCGEVLALACNHLADPDDPIEVSTKECLIYIERIVGPPTMEQLVVLGEKYITCIRGQWDPVTKTWEHNFTSVALVVSYDDPDKRSVVTGSKRVVKGNPSAISIAPIRGFPSAELRKHYGHEVLHSIRGRWHGDD
jgi:hypothetical protein